MSNKQEPFQIKLWCSFPKNSPHLTEVEASQESTNGYYPQPHESVHILTFHSFKTHVHLLLQIMTKFLKTTAPFAFWTMNAHILTKNEVLCSASLVSITSFGSKLYVLSKKRMLHFSFLNLCKYANDASLTCDRNEAFYLINCKTSRLQPEE
jgi:hypothetical protein